MSAFKAAIDAGYAIEADLQVTKTGEAAVFHDRTVDRMTNICGKVRDQTPEQLAKLHLLETEDTIQTLQTHLDMVAGQVPLILEFKSTKGSYNGMLERAAELLKTYQGPLAVMSFNHYIHIRLSFDYGSNFC